jgi:hypothetical protein
VPLSTSRVKPNHAARRVFSSLQPDIIAALHEAKFWASVRSVLKDKEYHSSARCQKLHDNLGKPTE